MEGSSTWPRPHSFSTEDQRGLEPTSELASPRCVLCICINRDTQQKYRKGRQSQCGGCPVSILVFSFSIKGTKTGKEEKKKKENNNQLGYGFWLRIKANFSNRHTWELSHVLTQCPVPWRNRGSCLRFTCFWLWAPCPWPPVSCMSPLLFLDPLADVSEPLA